MSKGGRFSLFIVIVFLFCFIFIAVNSPFVSLKFYEDGTIAEPSVIYYNFESFAEDGDSSRIHGNYALNDNFRVFNDFNYAMTFEKSISEIIIENHQGDIVKDAWYDASYFNSYVVNKDSFNHIVYQGVVNSRDVHLSNLEGYDDELFHYSNIEILKFKLVTVNGYNQYVFDISVSDPIDILKTFQRISLKFRGISQTMEDDWFYSNFNIDEEGVFWIVEFLRQLVKPIQNLVFFFGAVIPNYVEVLFTSLLL